MPVVIFQPSNHRSIAGYNLEMTSEDTVLDMPSSSELSQDSSEAEDRNVTQLSRHVRDR